MTYSLLVRSTLPSLIVIGILVLTFAHKLALVQSYAPSSGHRVLLLFALIYISLPNIASTVVDLCVLSTTGTYVINFIRFITIC